MRFIGERQGAALHPLKGLLKKSLKNPQNLKNHIYESFLKVLGILKGLAIFAEGKFALSEAKRFSKVP